MMNWITKWLNFFKKTPKKRVVASKRVDFFSKSLNNSRLVDIWTPPTYSENTHELPIVFFNDGQDLEAVQLENTLNDLYQKKKIKAAIFVGIHALDRMQEYGTAAMADYAGRGSQAGKYTNFILKELLPYLKENYRINEKSISNTFAGFSLGGLSALDIVWHNAAIFSNVGVFSGALWWRSKAFQEDNPDADRIIHDTFAQSKMQKGMRFWLQTGTNDETSDRNKNGIIDSIDDTLDLIKVLKKIGYKGDDITYVEVEKGEHNPATWARVLPDFLVWALRK